MADPTPGTAPVIDHRIPPPGLLPRHMQTWLMAALAIGIVVIIVVTGRPQPTSREAAATTTAGGLSPDRLREYQDRLRGLDARVRQQPAAEPAVSPRAISAVDNHPSMSSPSAPATPPDPDAADRKRREYQSLFSTNVVLTRRPNEQRLTTAEAAPRPPSTGAIAADAVPAIPSLDEVAEAVVRATTRQAAPAKETVLPSPAAALAPATAPTRQLPPPTRSTETAHRILEGTVIDTVLTNRLDGTAAAPVNCLVTNPVYAQDGQVVLIPAGARVLGQTKPVQAFGETRLAVAFTRLVMPDGRTYPLDHFMGLNAIGDAGLRDQVDQHYRTTFGASAAIGLLSGLGQFVAGAALGGGASGRPIVIAGGVSDASTQATAQTMNRFLNRLPSVTIREGHRVKVYLTSDLELPDYPTTRDRRRPALLADRQ